MERVSKTARGVQYLKEGNWRGALSIFSTFRYDFSKEERRIIQIAHECRTGHEHFYQGLGIDTCSIIAKAKEILKRRYLSEST